MKSAEIHVGETYRASFYARGWRRTVIPVTVLDPPSSGKVRARPVAAPNGDVYGDGEPLIFATRELDPWTDRDQARLIETSADVDRLRYALPILAETIGYKADGVVHVFGYHDDVTLTSDQAEDLATILATHVLDESNPLAIR